MNVIKDFYRPPPWNLREYKVVQSKGGMFYYTTKFELKNHSPFRCGNDTIKVDFYEVSGNDRPCVIIHPVISEDPTMIKRMAFYFATVHRWNTAVIHRADYPFDTHDPFQFQQRMRDAVSMDIQVFDWMNHFNMIHSSRTFSMGISFGGILNTALTAILPYRAFVSIVPGAPIVDVVMNSEYEMFKTWVADKMEEYDMNKQQLSDFYSSNIKCDPLDAIKGVDASHKVLFIGAKYDKIVKTEYQERIVRGYRKPPVTWWLPTGHMAAQPLITALMPVIGTWLGSRL